MNTDADRIEREVNKVLPLSNYDKMLFLVNMSKTEAYRAIEEVKTELAENPVFKLVRNAVIAKIQILLWSFVEFFDDDDIIPDTSKIRDCFETRQNDEYVACDARIQEIFYRTDVVPMKSVEKLKWLLFLLLSAIDKYRKGSRKEDFSDAYDKDIYWKIREIINKLEKEVKEFNEIFIEENF